MTEPTPIQRRPAMLMRGMLACALFLGASNASSAEECDNVPAERRAQCEKVMDCLTIDDTAVRRACIAAAQREGEADSDGPRPLSVDDVLRPQPSRTRSRVAQPERPAPRSEPPVREAEPSPAPVATQRRVEPARSVPAQPAQTSAYLPAPESNFSGKVTGIFQSVLNRQLIAIDGAYLFESDDASQARLKIGQTVELEKARSRILTGRQWRLVGPARRPIQAFRIRCEIPDIKRDDRRKCEQMLDR